MNKIAGYILTGGKNRRMGGQKKAFLTLNGETFLTRIRRAMHMVDQVYLSVEDLGSYEAAGLPMIEDIYKGIGPIGGLYSGLSSCDAQALLVVPCDTPLVTDEMLEEIIERYMLSGKCVISQEGPRLHPLLGIYTKEVVPVLEEMIQAENYRIRDLLHEIDYEIVDFTDHGIELGNINSPDEYEKLLNEYIVTVEEAQDILLRNVQQKEKIEVLPVTQALGRVLAEDLYARYDQPPFPRSPLDGYAVRAADIENASAEQPVKLKVIDEVMAGGWTDAVVEEGQAVRIMTGAPIPAGADCVIRQEVTDYGEETVEIYDPVKAYQNYCFQGEEYKTGTCLLKKGSRIDAIAIGIISGMGRVEINVFVQPKVAVFTTGDELLMPPGDLPPGKIYNSNLFVLESRLKELGITPAITYAVPDDESAMVQAIKDAASQTDLIITTGGVSVGKKDIMHTVLQKAGAQRLFWKVRLKPGTPTIGAILDGTLIICLSGNPFGAIANMELLVRPVLSAMCKDPKMAPTTQKATMAADFPKVSPSRRFIRAICEDGQVWLPEGLHASGVLNSMYGCNCMIDIPAGTQALKTGDRVCIILL